MAVETVLITVDKVREDSIEAGGKKLYLANMARPSEHVRVYGEVVRLPQSLGPEHNKEDLHLISVGDRIYFHYNTLISASHPHPDIENGYFIPWQNIFGKVRDDGTVMPMPGWTTCEPDFKKGVEKIKMTEVLDLMGHEKVMEYEVPIIGQPDAVSEVPEERTAIIREVGLPRKDAPDLRDDLPPGTRVFRDKYTNLKYNLEGEDLFFVEQDLILGKYV